MSQALATGVERPSLWSRSGPARPGRPASIRIDEARVARAEIASWKTHRTTPLLRLDSLASRIGVERIWIKHEGERLPLRSFKMLGGPFALARLAAQRLGAQTTAEIMNGEHADELRDLVAVCASDGNHGRAVAWAAQAIGCRARIYLPASVSAGRAAAIASFGAEVVRVDNNYDAAVLQAAHDASANGWEVISDFAYPGYEEVPQWVMEGYTTMAAEALAQIANERPTHVFLQVGCGSMAAAVMAFLDHALEGPRPTYVAVEPLRAACLMASLERGSPWTVEGEHQTVMGGLACGEVSLLAWPDLRDGIDHVLAVGDAPAIDAMRLLAAEQPAIVVGETGGSGLAGLLASVDDASLAATLGLHASSKILLFATEGATDSDEYVRLVGRPPYGEVP